MGRVPLLRRLAPVWQVQRRRRPALAAAGDTAVLAVRTRGDLVGEVRALRQRVAELERDHRLLAAHVATLTERVAEAPAAAPDDAQEQERRDRARLAAIAFYEERIGRLEALADRRTRKGQDG